MLALESALGARSNGGCRGCDPAYRQTYRETGSHNVQAIVATFLQVCYGVPSYRKVVGVARNRWSRNKRPAGCSRTLSNGENRGEAFQGYIPPLSPLSSPILPQHSC